jgi:hypothetical protein
VLLLQVLLQQVCSSKGREQQVLVLLQWQQQCVRRYVLL